jgi:hypothetical protein
VEGLVYKYLDKNCYLKQLDDCEIYCKETDERKFMLCHELSNIFSITIEEARDYSDNWANSLVPNIDLIRYWIISIHRPFTGFVSPGIYTIQRDNTMIERANVLIAAGEYY